MPDFDTVSLASSSKKDIFSLLNSPTPKLKEKKSLCVDNRDKSANKVGLKIEYVLLKDHDKKSSKKSNKSTPK